MKITDIIAQTKSLHYVIDQADNRGEYDPEALNAALRETLVLMMHMQDLMHCAGVFGSASLFKGED